MTRAVAILLLLLLCFQFFFKAGIAGYYLANKAYIAEVLCINKANAGMHCDGKCYLREKMKAAGASAPEAAVLIKYEAPEFVGTERMPVPVLPESARPAYCACCQGAATSDFCSAVFQPPC